MSVYLDGAATTSPAPEVFGAMDRALRDFWGNPSSLHRPGRDAENLMTSSRVTVAEALGAASREFFFTSGGTEANNWAILSAAHKMRHRGKHIISTAVEHDSVRKPLKFLESQGWTVTFLSPKGEGFPPLLKSALRADTVLVTAMLVNNETGTVLPVSELAAITHKNSAALFHTDGVQGFLKIPFTVGSLGADLLTVSAHKLHGPKGVGGLWIKDGVKLPPILHGGGQEQALRPGTEALHSIAGFGAAVTAAKSRMESDAAKYRTFQATIRETLARRLPKAEILPMGAPHIMSISLPGYKSQVLLSYLDAKGIHVSNGSACKRGARSHVLEAMGLLPRVIDGTVRVSFSRFNTAEDIDLFCGALIQAAETLFSEI